MTFIAVDVSKTWHSFIHSSIFQRMITFYVLGNDDTALNETGKVVAFMELTDEQKR